MPYRSITLEFQDTIAILTLNQPDRLNALTAEMQHELIAAASDLADSHARSVVIRGAGRAFCAGVSIDEFAALSVEPDEDLRYEGFALGRDLADALEAIPQVTIAALHGFVVGGGVVLASTCDLRVAARDTSFSIPEIDLGITLGWGGIRRLLRDTGPALTKELVMTGRIFTASEALTAGFLNSVVETADLDDAALSLARAIAGKPHGAIRTTKRHIAEILDGDLSRDDALTAVESMNDPESVAARTRYLESMRGSS